LDETLVMMFDTGVEKRAEVGTAGEREEEAA
jgi:hypothetical protein